MLTFLKKYKAEILAIYFVTVMILPNILLDFTETMPFLAKVVNILLPLSVYILITARCKHIGKGILWMTVFILMCAFQLVIMYLFSGSIVAIDMFLNVVTTSPSEATMLLKNLAVPMLFVTVIYLGMIIWSIIAAKKKQQVGDVYRRRGSRIGLIGTILGLCLMIIGQLTDSKFKTTRNIFPINVTSNFLTAFPRYAQSINYHKTSADFKFDACDIHQTPDSLREIHVLMIGETSRASNWQLAGYERETNPLLSKRDDITFFDRSVSQSNITHKCVPMLMSHIEAESFDSIRYVKSIITAFKEAGYHTAFFTTQPKNRSYNQFFGEEADHYEFIGWEKHNDGDLVELFKEEVNNSDAHKIFVLLHTYGSHFRYQDRYPAEMEHFTPTDASDAKRRNRPKLINAYDNSIRFTDYLINDIIQYIDSIGAVGSLVYTSDHGEDIFDDSRDRFLHSSPYPTYYQIHVPTLIWTSPAYNELYPEIAPALDANKHQYLSAPQALFHTMSHISGLHTPYFIPSKSLASPEYTEPTPMYVNDYNEAVPLFESGLKQADIDILIPIVPTKK